MTSFEQYIKPLVDWLNVNPHWAGIITFVISFAESLAIIGSVIPGSVTMAGIGVLIGAGVIPAFSTFTYAILGAIAGDTASYALGFYFKDRLREFWPFSKYPSILTKGDIFFQKHGSKSVFIGRFAGPLRSIVPVIAGMLNMPQKSFITANVLSAIAWSFAYIMPGVLLGAASTELSPEATTNLLIVALIIFIKLWTLAWVVKHMSSWTFNRINHFLNVTWQKMRSHKFTQPIAHFLADPTRPERSTQLGLALVFLFSLSLFILLAFNVSKQGITTAWNNPLFYLFQSFRTHILDNTFIAITFLGETQVMGLLVLVIFLWLCWQRQWHTALHWFGNAVVVVVAIYATKHLVGSLRPEEFNIYNASPSYPSGHTALFTVVVGFLTYLITHQVKLETRIDIIITFVCAVGLIAVSRLYLGAHWLTDVVGALLLGISCLTYTIISYHRHPMPQLPLKQLCLLSAATLLGSWLLFASFHFKEEVRTYHLSLPTHFISIDTWWQEDYPQLPIYRLNLIGQPSSLLNLQWASPLEKIESTLGENHWQKIDKPKLSKMIYQIKSLKQAKNLGLLSQQYQFQRPVLVMTKAATESQPALILLLWDSNYHFTDKKIPLWIGTIQYKKNGKISGANKTQLLPVTDHLIPILKKDLKWKLLNVNNLPKTKPADSILLIKSKE